ncbi:hypothetical protein BX661DRAFT_168236 [Kickxella alabastrina]|uniref:uncharacterized protein n=1 Tax=Kickxella alabastrina TaxID=61397 RepID=UPI002220C918|nr:uncharacterized protein BX661DRAFT_168236 [Kickxella alabastrina]KAI7835065.1 hypothetical protein BX661DRAFT_168236 [Kickxella alabastrina]
MQNNIPQYILDRGASARDYRRRSSCVSRTSNSSINYTSLQKDEHFLEEELPHSEIVDLPEVNLENYQLSPVTERRSRDEYRGTIADLRACNSTYMQPPSDQHFRGLPIINSTQPDDDKPDSPHLTVLNTTDSPQKNQPQQRRQSRFGVARPKLIHF